MLGTFVAVAELKMRRIAAPPVQAQLQLAVRPAALRIMLDTIVASAETKMQHIAAPPVQAQFRPHQLRKALAVHLAALRIMLDTCVGSAVTRMRIIGAQRVPRPVLQCSIMPPRGGLQNSSKQMDSVPHARGVLDLESTSPAALRLPA